MRYIRSFLPVFATLLALASPTRSSAQFLEAGFMVGAANYRGDLADRLVPTEYQTSYGMTLRYNFSPKFSARANLLTGFVSGADANNLYDASIRERNLSFRSDFTELSVQAEYSPLGFDVLDGKVSSPYLFVGLGGFYFNPQAELNGVWYDLQPLGTEGQGQVPGSKKYNRFAATVPMGLGFRFCLGKRVNLGLEFGARRTFTDYLDDVSGQYPDVENLYEVNPLAARLSYRRPEVMGGGISNPTDLRRGNPNTKDWYFIGGLTLSFNLTDKYGLEWNKKYRIYDK